MTTIHRSRPVSVHAAAPAVTAASSAPDRVRRTVAAFATAALLLLATARLVGAQSVATDVADRPTADATVGVAPTAPAAPATPTAATARGPLAAPSALAFAESRALADAASRIEAATSDEERRRRRASSGLRRNFALIGVGVAAIIVGDSVDDAPGRILEIGGAGLVLYGAYRILAGS